MAISNSGVGIRTGVCTSTTRPTAPYEGQHIYETDTDIEYVWSGTAWVVNYVSAASPAFTGTPTAPTATAGTNTTQLATTEFANAAGGLVFVKSQAVGSGVGSVTVSSAFSATYDNYVVVYQGGTVSTPANINLALGSSTTTYFQSLVYGQYSDTAPSFASTNNNRTSWAWVGGGDTNSVFVNVTLMAPFLSYYTRLLGGTYNGPNASGWTSGIHKTASSYTAFTITPEAGTLSGGTVSVYGYRK